MIKAENGWICRKELTKPLGVKDGTLIRWVRGGLISPVKASRNAQYFDQEVVEKFTADYITAEKAAKILGVGRLTVQKWARQGRLIRTCVSGSGIDGCHVYLFETKKLLQWRAERLTFGQAAQLLGVSGSTLHCWVDKGKIVPLSDMGGQQRWFSTKDLLELEKTPSGLWLSRAFGEG